MADDIAALLGHLEIEQADVMGYSLGGGVALQTAIRHPEVVRKLVVVSTPFKRDGWYPEILAGMGQMGPEAAEPMQQTPMYQLYASVAPKPEDWPVLLTKLGQLLGEDYDWSEDVAAMEVPTLASTVTPFLDAPIEYNYRTEAEHEQAGTSYYVEGEQPIEAPGRSCFLHEGDRVFYTYSVYARGLETVGGSYYFLDETALGRQEDWEEPKGRATDARGAVPNFSS
jgi:pimeloyl-ACP methyl ester carboxylesterase